MMRRVVVGTAGHIDHGKTTLVKALSGVDTDRLGEEKRRGITIELGFAPWKLGDELEASIVDVPGHEKLVRTMVAGAAGMDVAIVVVAADDGVMPQTREHLDILRLLDVQKIVVAMTKIDLVDEEMCLLVEDDIESVLKEKHFVDVVTIKTSSQQGHGLDVLKDEVVRLCGETINKSSRPFLMPIDRAFVREGHGTVVTGTPLRGELALGDHVEAFGAGAKHVGEVKVRGLQNVGQALERVCANMRTAINISGKHAHHLKRGMNLFKDGAYLSSQHLVVWLETLASVDTLKEQTLALHLGTGSQLAEMVFCVGKSLDGEGSGGALLRLKEPIVAFAGQRFVLRKPGAEGQATVAGGYIVDPLPARGKGSVERAGQLCACREDDQESLFLMLKQARASGLHLQGLRQRLRVENLEALLQHAEGEGAICRWPDGDKRWVLRQVVDALLAKTEGFLSDHQRQEPLSQGLKEAELVALVAKPEQELLQAMLKSGLVSKKIVREEAFWRLSSEGSLLDAKAKADLDKILEMYQKAENMPPLEAEVLAQAGISAKEFKALVDYLVADGKLVKVKPGLYYSYDTIASLGEQVLQYLREQDEMAAADFKDLAGGISRKWAIPLLEYFDAKGMTVRVGNARKLHPKMREAGV
ncbi:MAG: selenocysteine-specific translation elongation factor [Myxococcota bacterium]|jgi:selenocysteine-specific elongation factor|nr:selenocysteine-specific translation elongation factor [Myxococcota bacterium]